MEFLGQWNFFKVQTTIDSNFDLHSPGLGAVGPGDVVRAVRQMLYYYTL